MHECPLMGHAKQVLQSESQRGTNAEAQSQPNLASLGPPPMVLQNPLPLQGLVATAPMPPPSLVAPPTETVVHHLLAMTTNKVNLQTRQNQYGSNTKTYEPSAASMSNATNIPLHLPTPPFDGTT